MIKKIGLIVAAFGMLVLLAACGTNSSSAKNDSSSSKSMSSSETKSMSTKAASTGEFMGENGKKVSGTYEINDDQLVFTNFKTDMGPNLHVLLTNGNDAKNGKEVSKIDLKKATQTFSLKGIDTSKYDQVTIYCETAHVVFGGAPMPQKDTMAGMFKGENKKNVSGTATVGNDTLKLTNFKTDMGPALHVYLTMNGDIKNGKEISAIDLKKVTQEFSLKGIDASQYNQVTIYCQQAKVTFGSADLAG